MKRSEYRTSLMGWRAALITLAASIIGFAAVVIPLLNTVVDRDGTITARDQRIDELEQELDSANAKLEVRQEAIAELRDENRELRAALPYTVAPEDVHDIRATATLTLAKRGDTLDLNSALPNFGAADFVYSDTLSYSGDRLVLGYGASTVVLGSGNADYATCAAATGWSRGSSLDPHQLEAPTTCVRLQSDRYVAIQVLRYDANSVDVTITVWE